MSAMLLVVSLGILLLVALAKPLRLLLRFALSAGIGGVLLYLGSSLGLSVGINAWTLLVSGVLGLPGVAGIAALSILL